MAAKVTSGHQPSSNDALGRFEVGQIETVLKLDPSYLFYPDRARWEKRDHRKTKKNQKTRR